jgi:hypothetical protein
MRTLIIFGLILLILALNSEAATPLVLTGSSGKAILTQIASNNVTNEVTKAIPGNLWNWGQVPMNYEVDQSGKLSDISAWDEPAVDEDNLWLESKKNEMEEINLSEYA